MTSPDNLHIFIIVGNGQERDSVADTSPEANTAAAEESGRGSERGRRGERQRGRQRRRRGRHCGTGADDAKSDQKTRSSNHEESGQYDGRGAEVASDCRCLLMKIGRGAGSLFVQSLRRWTNNGPTPTFRLAGFM